MSTDPEHAPLPPAGLWPALLRPAQQAVNRILAMDPAAADRLAALDGRQLEVHLSAVPTPLRVGFRESGLTLAVADESDPAADATLSVSPSALATLALSNGQRGGRELSFQGDVGVIQDVRRLFSELDIDWEEQLSQVLGDVLAHQVGNAVRDVGDWLRHAGNTLLDNTGEYLTEERHALPSAAEVEGFIAGVDQIRQDADRLQARIKRLQRRSGGEG